MIVSEDIKYVGVNDHQVDLFEGQYVVPEGMAYNSYVVLDDKIAVMDTVDVNFGQEWLNNVQSVLAGRKPSYLVVHHMEPDHSANITLFMETFPEAVVVASDKAFTMMKNFFGQDYVDRRVVVKEGSVLDLGSHQLTFISAPMVHWPEVVLSYEAKDKVLFASDAFGKFGANDVESDDGWACEARRYYMGIVGKYGAQVQALLQKAKKLDIQTICPLHGPVLTDNLGYYLNLYDIWSSYGVEDEGVTIAYTSVYGHTKAAALLLAEKLQAAGCPKVAVHDLQRMDMAEAVEDAFRHSKLVLATPTYNGDIFPAMKHFIDALLERGYKNRTIGIIENGSWAIMAGKVIRKLFENSKNIQFTENTVSIMSAMNEANKEQLTKLAAELA